MNVGWWTALLLTVAAAGAAAVAPAAGQTVSPAEPSASGAQSRAPVPDFSGIWGHLTWPDFGQPSSGPGPVRNTSIRNGLSDIYLLVGDYANPILKPQAAQAVKTYGDVSRSGVPAPTPSNQCWPGGVPFVLWNTGMQMIQQPSQLIILYANDHEVRRVRLNEQHPAQVTPSWYGDSVGHYEGDVLVIDTIGVKVGPFAMVDMYGTPHTAALHVVERYRMLDYDAANAAEEQSEKGNFRLAAADAGFAPDRSYKGKGLQLQFTVEDDGVFTTPWSATIIYRRPLSSLGEWPEHACAEHPDGYYPGKKSAAPTADKPDF